MFFLMIKRLFNTSITTLKIGRTCSSSLYHSRNENGLNNDESEWKDISNSRLKRYQNEETESYDLFEYSDESNKNKLTTKPDKHIIHTKKLEYLSEKPFDVLQNWNEYSKENYLSKQIKKIYNREDNCENEEMYDLESSRYEITKKSELPFDVLQNSKENTKQIKHFENIDNNYENEEMFDLEPKRNLISKDQMIGTEEGSKSNFSFARCVMIGQVASNPKWTKIGCTFSVTADILSGATYHIYAEGRVSDRCSEMLKIGDQVYINGNMSYNTITRRNRDIIVLSVNLKDFSKL